jgi:hypothetical protein
MSKTVSNDNWVYVTLLVKKKLEDIENTRFLVLIRKRNKLQKKFPIPVNNQCVASIFLLKKCCFGSDSKIKPVVNKKPSQSNTWQSLAIVIDFFKQFFKVYEILR